MNKKKKKSKLSHLENVFMKTPVASVNESTGGMSFIHDTTFEKCSEDVLSDQKERPKIYNPNKK